jgi:hypothetical protein
VSLLLKWKNLVDLEWFLLFFLFVPVMKVISTCKKEKTHTNNQFYFLYFSINISIFFSIGFHHHQSFPWREAGYQYCVLTMGVMRLLFCNEIEKKSVKKKGVDHGWCMVNVAAHNEVDK